MNETAAPAKVAPIKASHPKPAEARHPEPQDPPIVTKMDKAESMVVWIFGTVVIPIGVVAWVSVLAQVIA